jgi:hypothetical protein
LRQNPMSLMPFELMPCFSPNINKFLNAISSVLPIQAGR